MKKLISVLLLCLFLLPFVFADGMIIRPDPSPYIIERGQVAYIDYNKDSNLEKMILGIKVDNVHNQKAAWIFPVPSSPNDVAIDVVPNLPNYYGQEVKSYARNIIDDIVETIVAYQIWPVMFLFSGRVMYGGMKATEDLVVPRADIETGQSVVVYEHIEKYGLTTELVGAKDGAAIRLYLVNKGLEVPFEANTILRYYADKDYTFVVSWFKEQGNPPYYEIQPLQKGDVVYPDYYYNYRQVGVQVMFKTDKAYYPLLPTSVYGSEKVPATIYFNGYVEPVVPEGIKSFTKATYMKNSASSYYAPADKVGYFTSGNPNEYTVISINDVPSKFFTDDMWFEEGSPEGVEYASSFVDRFDQNRGTKAWFIVLAISVILGSLLGFIIFREQWWKLALVSLTTAFSIIGLVIALFFVKTRKVDSTLKQKIRQAGLVTVSRDFTRKFIFVLSFSILFVILAYLLGVILKAPLS